MNICRDGHVDVGGDDDDDDNNNNNNNNNNNKAMCILSVFLFVFTEGERSLLI
jgi:hypothetical protein